MSVFCFICWYYPIGLYRNAEHTDQVHSRGITIFLLVWAFFMFTSTFAHMMIAGLPNADTAAGAMNLLFVMMFCFCGILAGPNELPGFWIFMYRVSPFTYWVSGMVSTQLHDRRVVCSEDETSVFDPPTGDSCGQYMAPFLSQAPGTLQNPEATEQCRYCSLTVADQYFAGSNIYWGDRWRNFGIMWAFVLFNVFIAVFTYWAFRVKHFKLSGLGGSKQLSFWARKASRKT